MAIVVLSIFTFVVLVTLAWATTQDSGAAGVPSPSANPSAYAAVRVSAPEKCRSARAAVPFYRGGTWEWQQKRAADELADRTPVVRGKSCHWARYAASEWVERARAAREAFAQWWESRGRVVALLNDGLAGSPMEGTGADLERAGREYGVSPYFMAAVAATESSLGAAACGSGGYNAWGLGNCGSAWSVPSFGSWREAYDYYAKFLTRWAGHSTPYSFRGYAACDECWARKVSEWMHTLFGVPAVTRYP